MFFGLFRKKEERKDSSLRYDNRLIDRFSEDHRLLAEAARRIEGSWSRGERRKTVKLLKRMEKAVLHHFMQEDMKLYWFLKKHYADDPAVLATIRHFEDSIKPIQKEVVLFFDRYARKEAVLDETFKKDFDAIVRELSRRIEAEEAQLYPLYRQG